MSDDLMSSPNARGLCLNCDDAEICKYAGFGDDVLFCEEHSSNFDNAWKKRLSDEIYTDLPDLGKNLIPGWNK